MMCLTSDKLVYSWGSGENGILGHGNHHGLNKPQLIKELRNEEIIFIAAGEFNSAAININGHLFTWGKGKYGMLGHGIEENSLLPKRVIDSTLQNERVFFVSMGFHHTLCATRKYLYNFNINSRCKDICLGIFRKGSFGLCRQIRMRSK
jgi:hypothetical protein